MHQASASRTQDALGRRFGLALRPRSRPRPRQSVEQRLPGRDALGLHVENPAAIELTLAARQHRNTQHTQAARAGDPKRDVIDAEMLASEPMLRIEPFDIALER